jgi:hypothetical protein
MSPIPIEYLFAHRFDRYNGTSELQLERMNVYFNEVSAIIQLGSVTRRANGVC